MLALTRPRSLIYCFITFFSVLCTLLTLQLRFLGPPIHTSSTTTFIMTGELWLDIALTDALPALEQLDVAGEKQTFPFIASDIQLTLGHLAADCISLIQRSPTSRTSGTTDWLPLL